MLDAESMQKFSGGWSAVGSVVMVERGGHSGAYRAGGMAGSRLGRWTAGLFLGARRFWQRHSHNGLLPWDTFNQHIPLVKLDHALGNDQA